jgi:hypothetical protein
MRAQMGHVPSRDGSVNQKNYDVGFCTDLEGERLILGRLGGSQPKIWMNKSKRMIPLRLELRTACVLDRSDNQLHHRTNC